MSIKDDDKQNIETEIQMKLMKEICQSRWIYIYFTYNTGNFRSIFMLGSGV